MLSLSDARVLGRLADGVILVFFARSTSRDAALTAVELFREDHTPVLGTILNHWNPKRNPAQTTTTATTTIRRPTSPNPTAKAPRQVSGVRFQVLGFWLFARHSSLVTRHFL